MSDEAVGGDAEPLLRVVRGTPTPAELAALVAVVAVRRTSSATREGRSPSEWGSPARAVRAPLHPTADGWRRSGLPR